VLFVWQRVIRCADDQLEQVSSHTQNVSHMETSFAVQGVSKLLPERKDEVDGNNLAYLSDGNAANNSEHD